MLKWDKRYNKYLKDKYKIVVKHKLLWVDRWITKKLKNLIFNKK